MPGRTRILSSPVPGVFATLSATGQTFDKHWHDAYGVGILDRGGQSWRSRRGTVEAYSGAVINTTPGEVHDGRPIGGTVRRWRIVTIPAHLLGEIVGDGGGDIDIKSPVIEDPTVASAFRRLFVLFDQWTNGERSDADVLAFESALSGACALFVSRHGTRRIDVNAVDVDVSSVRDRLADVSSAAPSLGELAANTGLSRYQLLRRFKSCYGLPPHAWLLTCRCERARSSIAAGETLSRAALRSGFADQSHMTRTFVRLYGYTPGFWQRAFTRPAEGH